MAAYCTTFYTQQRKIEDRFPVPDISSRLAFARRAATSAHRTESLLVGLKPPSDLAAAFAEFVSNARDVSDARAAIVDTFPETGGVGGEAGEAFDQAFAERRRLATILHAPGCDGELPARQRAAVIDALMKFETTTDSAAACGDLATPGYLLTRWSGQADPLAWCIATREADRRSPAWHAQDIKVQSVTGSDGVAATANYTGTCRCPNGATARFHLVDGSWLISEGGH
jgi:hypothetical protein